MTAAQPSRHTIGSLTSAGRLAPPTVTFAWSDPYVAHYGRHEALCDALAAFADVADVGRDLGWYDRFLVLQFLLPGVDDLRTTWCDLVDPLERYARLDGAEAVSIEQERGQRAPNSVDSYARVRDELRQEIGDVIRAHRRTTTGAA